MPQASANHLLGLCQTSPLATTASRPLGGRCGLDQSEGVVPMRRINRRINPVYRICLLLLLVPLVLAACSSGQGGSSSTSVAADVKAAQGATLTHPNGATLTIPPGALAGD